ncbi:MAG TPA: hypothetical protein VFZ01_19430 [Geminicoccaceae bacterium]
MTRILGEAQSGRSFWLVLLLAVALLVGVSTTAARAEAAAMARIERDLGALHVLTESLDGAASRRIPAPIHPALADGSEDYLRNASVRRIVALQRRLGALEEIATGAPSGASSRRALAREADRLHWLLLAPAGDPALAADLGPTLQRMSLAWAALVRPVAAGSVVPEPPLILRGRPL